MRPWPAFRAAQLMCWPRRPSSRLGLMSPTPTSWSWSTPNVSVEAEQRLEAMVRTQNGFEIAELDLQQRGPGEFFGTKQAGMPNFRVANLLRDRELLEAARREARYV